MSWPCRNVQAPVFVPVKPNQVTRSCDCRYHLCHVELRLFSSVFVLDWSEIPESCCCAGLCGPVVPLWMLLVLWWILGGLLVAVVRRYHLLSPPVQLQCCDSADVFGEF